MISIGVQANLYENTPIELKVYPPRNSGGFVSVKIDGADGSGLSLIASTGQADALRRLAQVATEGAAELDRLTAQGGGAA
ncbi:hypothetical protein ACOKM5_20875 [Streptomyces sp. BH097]|uniref:hypothetical protein n=1 Tax=Streptomyces sp. BH097 TaxID=3410406 RepID=UPI003CEAFF7D